MHDLTDHRAKEGEAFILQKLLDIPRIRVAQTLDHDPSEGQWERIRSAVHQLSKGLMVDLTQQRLLQGDCTGGPRSAINNRQFSEKIVLLEDRQGLLQTLASSFRNL